MTETIKQAIFGAGCYWGSEAAFRRAPGVVDTCVGYMADSLCGEGAPTSDDDAHALRHVEVVMVDYSPDTVTYQDLLALFWDCLILPGPHITVTASRAWNDQSFLLPMTRNECWQIRRWRQLCCRGGLILLSPR